jgi:hypothetical protein
MNSTDRQTDGASRWATDEFGDAQLGNTLRTERLMTMAASALRDPAGLLTEVFRGGGEREGAYKFAENEHVSIREIGAAACRAAATRAIGLPYVFVPVDGSSLSLREYQGETERGTGSIGSYQKKGTGVHIMNAIVVDPQGVPLGLFDQQWWVRQKESRTYRRKRTLEQKETKHWLAAIGAGAGEWAKANPSTRPWFQLDRGGDFRELLTWAQSNEHWVTVRAAYDRRTLESDDDYLWATLENSPIRAKVEVALPATKKRQARTAKLELHWAQVTLRLTDRWRKTESPATLWALLAREKSAAADGSEPVEWMLLTNYEINSKAAAELVLFGYTQRWRVEQFHKTWKSVCKVEKTQLREIAHIERWATILASVAMRVLRLSYLARVHPQLPATTELSAIEIATLIIHRGDKRRRLGDALTIEEATRWIADLGGYVGPASAGGPPGTIVLARGLRTLNIEAMSVRKVIEFVK